MLNKHFGSFFCIKSNHLILQLSTVQICDASVRMYLFSKYRSNHVDKQHRFLCDLKRTCSVTSSINYPKSYLHKSQHKNTHYSVFTISLLKPNDIFSLRFLKAIRGTRIAIGYIILPSIKCKIVFPKQQLKYKPLICLPRYNCTSKHACKIKTSANVLYC